MRRAKKPLGTSPVCAAFPTADGVDVVDDERSLMSRRSAGAAPPSQPLGEAAAVDMPYACVRSRFGAPSERLLDGSTSGASSLPGRSSHGSYSGVAMTWGLQPCPGAEAPFASRPIFAPPMAPSAAAVQYLAGDTFGPHLSETGPSDRTSVEPMGALSPRGAPAGQGSRGVAGGEHAHTLGEQVGASSGLTWTMNSAFLSQCALRDSQPAMLPVADADAAHLQSSRSVDARADAGSARS